MKGENRMAVYDDGLRLEAYRFEGTRQPFPNHFHSYYVIGLMERGERYLTCKHQEYLLRPGDMVLFNPGDNHACAQNDGGTLDYRALNIAPDVMVDLAGEITGTRELPLFTPNVICSQEAACCLRSLHEMVMEGSCEFEKEEYLFLLLAHLIQQYSRPFSQAIPACRKEVERACAFMKENFDQRLSLEEICRVAGLSKSSLLRAFTKAKGVTPYRYLENIRIGRAKQLLEAGVSPVEAALRTGFSDQSHFTNYFNRFIGLSPGVYRDIFWDKSPKEEETP